MAYLEYKFVCKSDVKEDTASLEIEWHIHQTIVKNLFDSKITVAESDSFNTDFKGSKWYLQLKKSEKDFQKLSIYLCNKEETAKISVQFNFELKANIGDNKKCTDKSWFDSSLGVHNECLLSKAQADSGRFWHDDFLIVTAKVQLKALENQFITTNVSNTSAPAKIKLEDRYKQLLESGLLSDVTLHVGNREFKVHRNILANSCDYFNAMFTGGLKESTQKIIKITDVTPEIFEAILKFIYSGEFPDDLAPIAKDLLIAADKYNLPPLVTTCEYKLSQDVNLENCIDLLVFADLYNLGHCLKNEVLTFMKKNIDEIKLKEEWNKLKESNLKLVVEVFEF